MDDAALDTPLSVAERVSHLSPEGQLMPTTASSEATPTAAISSPRRSRGQPSSKANRDTVATLAPGQAFPSSSQRLGRRPADLGAPRWGRLVLVGSIGLLGLGLLGFAAMRTAGWVASTVNGPKLNGRPLDISVTEPAVEIPSAPTADQQIGVNDVAQGVIEEWLAVKRAALGEDYQADKLEEILVEPVLTQWRRRAEAAPQENWYWEYEHNVEVKSVNPEDPTADQLQVTAVVSETARLFEYGVENTSASYDDVLTMRYDLIRQDGQWYVQNMSKLPSEN
ncbi:MAG: DUF4101 domain-containing protein [Leptolyngbyaceae cyanobacterium SM2_5_2]|nr:DUF4101 domain-containing protein [Leptolyngbyaceae cyanobacterium SM2_5_2]